MGYTDVILSQPPKGGGYIPLKEKIGHRLVFLGTHSIAEEPDTMNQGQTREVATVDYVDLDDGVGGEIKWSARVDKIGVVNKLRGQRTAIMGRLILGEAKPGKTAPFILDDHTPEDAAYFMNTWMPANRAALEGKEAPKAQAPQAAPAQQYVNAPAATAAFPGQVLPAPAGQYAQAGQAVAAAAAPAPAAATAPPNGQYPPEAMAALQRMMEAGQIPAFPVPGAPVPAQ